MRCLLALGHCLGCSTFVSSCSSSRRRNPAPGGLMLLRRRDDGNEDAAAALFAAVAPSYTQRWQKLTTRRAMADRQSQPTDQTDVAGGRRGGGASRDRFVPVPAFFPPRPYLPSVITRLVRRSASSPLSRPRRPPTSPAANFYVVGSALRSDL